MVVGLETLITERNRKWQEEHESLQPLSADQQKRYSKLVVRGRGIFDTIITGQVPNQYIVYGTDEDELIFPGISMGYHRLLYGDVLKRNLIAAEPRQRLHRLDKRTITVRTLNFAVPRSGRLLDPTVDFYHQGNSMGIDSVELSDLRTNLNGHCQQDLVELETFTSLSEEVLARLK